MYKKYSDGLIEVITGPMFSGKTEELIKRITILSYAEIPTLVIKPKIDNRFSNSEIISRSGKSIQSYAVENVEDIKTLFNQSEYRALVIDEVQFFGEALVEFIDGLANKGVHVIVCGLDQNYLRKPFGIMPQILAIAEHITKLTAVCLICKNAASCTYRKTKNSDEISIGDMEEYEARCRRCHLKK